MGGGFGKSGWMGWVAFAFVFDFIFLSFVGWGGWVWRPVFNVWTHTLSSPPQGGAR